MQLSPPKGSPKGSLPPQLININNSKLGSTYFHTHPMINKKIISPNSSPHSNKSVMPHLCKLSPTHPRKIVNTKKIKVKNEEQGNYNLQSLTYCNLNDFVNVNLKPQLININNSKLGSTPHPPFLFINNLNISSASEQIIK